MRDYDHDTSQMNADFSKSPKCQRRANLSNGNPTTYNLASSNLRQLSFCSSGYCEHLARERFYLSTNLTALRRRQWFAVYFFIHRALRKLTRAIYICWSLKVKCLPWVRLSSSCSLYTVSSNICFYWKYGLLHLRYDTALEAVCVTWRDFALACVMCCWSLERSVGCYDANYILVMIFDLIRCFKWTRVSVHAWMGGGRCVVLGNMSCILWRFLCCIVWLYKVVVCVLHQICVVVCSCLPNTTLPIPFTLLFQYPNFLPPRSSDMACYKTYTTYMHT